MKDNKHVSYLVGIALEITDKPIRGGYLVETFSGILGHTKHEDGLVDGKYLVYMDDGSRMMCSPNKLKLRGFVD